MLPTSLPAVPSYAKSTQQLVAWREHSGLKQEKIARFRSDELVIYDKMIASVFQRHLEAKAFLFDGFDTFEGETSISFSDPRAPQAFMVLNGGIREGFETGLYWWEVGPIDPV